MEEVAFTLNQTKSKEGLVLSATSASVSDQKKVLEGVLQGHPRQPSVVFSEFFDKEKARLAQTQRK